MITQRIIFILMILFMYPGSFCFTGCSHLNSTKESPKLNNTAVQKDIRKDSPLSMIRSAYPIITQIKTKDRLIIISSGPEYPLYSIMSDNGQILAVDIPADKLISGFPELKDIVENGIANWAGLDWWYQNESGKSSQGKGIYKRYF